MLATRKISVLNDVPRIERFMVVLEVPESSTT